MHGAALAGVLLVSAMMLVGARAQQQRFQRPPRQQWQQDDFDMAANPGASGPKRQDWSWPPQQGQFGQQAGQFGQQAGQSGQQPGGQQSTTPAPADGVLTVLPASCPCTALEQYNPVCGSDGNTYLNKQKLECFAQCGSNVTFVRLGVCRRRQDVPT